MDKETTPQEAIESQPENNQKKLFIIIASVILVILVAAGLWFFLKGDDQADNTSVSQTTDSEGVEALQLDPNKDYGNKYADGILPVGDQKYSATEAKKGYVYACDSYSQTLGNDEAAGAQTRGPWFVNDNTEYDINQKVSVQGSVSWEGSFTNTLSGGYRMITSNDLPSSHTTGTFPVSSSDPAYTYDRNPNTISAQSLSYQLAANPTYGTPQCMSGQVGIMLTGIAIFNSFDAGGRDAGAWETQDNCQGHPQEAGEYHYHTLSSCIDDVSVSKVIGFALDGFPITGPKVGDNNFLTTDDLDECHGIVSDITLDDQTVKMYHYVMTQDFPYSVSCFRSTPITPAGQGGGPSAMGPARRQ